MIASHNTYVIENKLQTLNLIKLTYKMGIVSTFILCHTVKWNFAYKITDYERDTRWSPIKSRGRVSGKHGCISILWFLFHYYPFFQIREQIPREIASKLQSLV